MKAEAKSQDRERLRIAVRGAVQGVGFRPFIFRLAKELRLAGWINNSPQGVFVEVEGLQSGLETFLARLESEKPPRCFIQSLEASWLDPVGYVDFEIRNSESGGDKTALVLPDIATCTDCSGEIGNPSNRRFRYPFTNCTNCGPRFSIIEALPYDRANTSMKAFRMCPACQAEYDDPCDRRFHAQPNACPICGPHLELWSCTGDALLQQGEALLAAAETIRAGRIVAVKGLGGFHLVVAAHDERALRRLRERKHREEKPFALMFPGMESVKAYCEVTPLEERLLRSPEAPIVLLHRHHAATITVQVSASVAPGNPNLGVMLPSNPLHHLLMAELGFPIVATSGNLGDEPICTDEREALERLYGIADVFLVHNRPIVRHVDDSIVRVMLDRELVLRRARGYAPLPIQLPGGGDPSLRDSPPASIQHSILAVGAHLKSTVAISVGSQVFVSQHIGDLETEGAYSAFRRVIADFEKLYDLKPDVFATDLHPDYLSTKFARSELDGRHIPVQHHIAHVLSCMAENEIDPPALGVAWDGTGYGLDGTSWGGEFFLINDSTADRIAHLRPFRLPGGDAAVKQPRRAALGLLYEIYGNDIFQRTDLAPVASFTGSELAALKTMLGRGLNSPPNTSAGRLFDAVASLLSLRQQVGFEGQAAMDLEFALEGIKTNEVYPLSISAPATASPKLPALPSSLAARQSPLTLDWAPMIEAILTERQRDVSVGEISAKFHNTLAEAIVQVARLTGEERVALSGGCFQNRYLTERSVQRLREEGFRPYWHQRVPPNDGGIALGQIVGARRELANREASSRLLQHSNRDQAQFACRSPSRPLESGERGNHLTSVQHLAS